MKEKENEEEGKKRIVGTPDYIAPEIINGKVFKGPC